MYYEREPDDKLEYLHLNYDADGYIAEGKYKGGFSFQVFVRVLTDGKSAAAQNKLSVENATYIIISSDILTTQDKKTSPSLLCALPEYESVKKRHVALFSEEIGGVVFRIDGNDAEITKKDDLRLAETYFDLGRYLFLSGTLRGELPLNLQGKWNRSVTPPWASDYHININLQMNYWAAEKVGFSRAVVPLKNYILKCARQGKSLAKNFYSKRICIHAQLRRMGDTLSAGVRMGCLDRRCWMAGAALNASFRIYRRYKVFEGMLSLF